VTWTELLAQAADPAQSQFVLDVALAAVVASHSCALDAVITAEVPTLLGLCAILDAHGVPVPAQSVAALFSHVEAPPLDGLAPLPQDLRLAH